MIQVLAGIFLGVGLWLLTLGIRQKQVIHFSVSDFSNRFNPHNLKRIALALAVCCAVWIFTGIFVAGLVLGVGIGMFKGRLGSKKQTRYKAEKSEAIASWAEMLYSILLAGGGIEKAIVVSAAIAPAPIKPYVKKLSQDLENLPLPEALEIFGEAMEHPASDKIVVALSLSVTQGAQDLVDLLKSQAESTRADSRLILELESGRSSHRTSALIVMSVTMTVALGLYIFEAGYLSPYKTFPGYLVLLFVGLGFMLGFWLLIRLGAESGSQRHFELGAIK